MTLSDDAPTRTEIEPETSSDLRACLDQFDDDHTFGVIYHQENQRYPSYRVVTAVETVRPVAVPVDHPPTFDMDVVETVDRLGDELRLTIEEIRHVRAADPSERGCE